MIRKTSRGEDSEVARCRRIRDELDGQFKTIDEALAYLDRLERKHKRKAVHKSHSKKAGKHDEPKKTGQLA